MCSSPTLILVYIQFDVTATPAGKQQYLNALHTTLYNNHYSIVEFDIIVIQSASFK